MIFCYSIVETNHIRRFLNISKGAHLPVAPETPAHVWRALEWIAAHPQKEEQVVRYVQPIVPVPVKPAYTPFRNNKF